MNASQPFLSVVATSRNDDHGGDALWRTQHFVDGLVAQSEKHKVPLELVLVDWNPVPNKAGLYEALNWPKASKYFQKRVITVPKSYHDRFRASKSLPLFQYLAKNIGIRRAKGDFILSTNIDILFSDGVFKKLKDLKEGVSYRAMRYDILPKHMKGSNFRGILKSVFGKGIRSHLQFHTTESKIIIYCVRALPYSMFYFGFLFFFSLKMVAIFLKKILKFVFACIKNIASLKLPTHNFFKKILKIRRFTNRISQIFHRVFCIFFQNFINYYVYTNASGDFTLLAKKDWFRLSGYPEFEMYSWHIDSLFLYQAYFQKIKTVVLGNDAPIYHIEHGKGSGWTPAGKDLLFGRLEKNGIPFLTDTDLSALFLEQKHRPNRLFNGKNWGGATETFQEQS